MSTKVLTDSEMFALLPTIFIGSDKPKTQTWLTQTDALKAMRDVEAEILRRREQHLQSTYPSGINYTEQPGRLF
jgi:hypothetical protein